MVSIAHLRKADEIIKGMIYSPDIEIRQFWVANDTIVMLMDSVVSIIFCARIVLSDRDIGDSSLDLVCNGRRSANNYYIK
jgi:hypothetical protein